MCGCPVCAAHSALALQQCLCGCTCDECGVFVVDLLGIPSSSGGCGGDEFGLFNHAGRGEYNYVMFDYMPETDMPSVLYYVGWFLSVCYCLLR